MERAWSSEEQALGAAQAELASAIERTREAGVAYFAAPLARSLDAREAYYDALRRQWEAERALDEAKRGVTRRSVAPRRP